MEQSADNNLVVTKQIASTIAALPGAIGNTVSDVDCSRPPWRNKQASPAKQNHT